MRVAPGSRPHRHPAGLLLLALLLPLVPAAASAAAASEPPAAAPAAASPAASPTPGAPSYGESTEVRVVEVPVQVTRNGEPVRGLTAVDFEVTSGRQRQRIVGFEVVDVQELSAASTAPRRPVAALPVAGRRHFLFLFDMSYSDPRSLQRAQQAALDVAGHGLQDGDLGAVATFSPAKGARLLLGFTSDRRQVELAISTLGSTELVERRPDYAGLLLGVARATLARAEAMPERAINRMMTAEGEGEDDPMPRVSETLARKMLDEALLETSMQERDLASAERDRVQRFTTSLGELADLMAQIQGRKQVIFLSRGFDSSLLIGQLQVEGRAIESADEELKEITRTESDRRWGNTRLQRALRESLDRMRRADCAIHAIDISGAEVEGRAIAGEIHDVASGTPVSGRGSDALFVMAEETGGTLYRNFNDLAAAMGKVLTETSVTYVLTIEPTGTAGKDGYVPLRVTVPAAKGAAVRHRMGYFATPPAAVKGALEERLRIASQVLEGRAGGQLAATLLALPAPWGAPGGQAIITVDGQSLLAEHSGDAVSAEVTLYAFDAHGAVRDHSRQLVGMDLRTVGDRLRRNGLRLLASLDLPPGRYDLRALVRNTVTGRYGIATGELVVPAGPGAAGLSASFVEPPPADWLLVREAAAEGAPAPSYPFTVGEKVFAPAPARLHPGQGAIVWVEAWPVAGAEGLAATVKRPDGTLVGPATLQFQEREPASAGERLLASVSPPALLPGSYLLELRVAGAGGVPATTTLPFVVE